MLNHFSFLKLNEHQLEEIFLVFKADDSMLFTINWCYDETGDVKSRRQVEFLKQEEMVRKALNQMITNLQACWKSRWSQVSMWGRFRFQCKRWDFSYLLDWWKVQQSSRLCCHQGLEYIRQSQCCTSEPCRSTQRRWSWKQIHRFRLGWCNMARNYFTSFMVLISLADGSWPSLLYLLSLGIENRLMLNQTSAT